MDSATLLRAGRRVTCRAGGESAWPRRARVDAAGACSAGARGVGASGETASWSRSCVSICPALHVDPHRSIQPPTHLPIHPYGCIHPLIHLPTPPPTYPCNHPPIHPPTYPFIHASNRSSIHPYKLGVMVNGCNLSIPEAEIELLLAPVQPFLPNESLCFKKRKRILWVPFMYWCHSRLWDVTGQNRNPRLRSPGSRLEKITY